MKVKSLSRVQLFVTPWIVAHQAPLSMGFSRQEYWSGLPFRSPGDLPDPGIEPGSPTLQADPLTFELPGKPQSIYEWNANSKFWLSNDYGDFPQHLEKLFSNAEDIIYYGIKFFSAKGSNYRKFLFVQSN